MLAISQNPDRVSNILRSSVVTMRLIGMRCTARPQRGGPGRAVEGGHATAPSWWLVAGGLALGLGGELEEHLLQAGAVGRAQLDERYAGGEGDGSDLRGFGMGEEAVGPDGGGGDACLDSARAATSRSGCAAPILRSGAGRPWLPPRRCGRCRSRRGHRRRPRSRAAGGRRAARCRRGRRSRAAGRASTGCPPGRGRWPARRGSAPPAPR